MLYRSPVNTQSSYSYLTSHNPHILEAVLQNVYPAAAVVCGLCGPHYFIQNGLVYVSVMASSVTFQTRVLSCALAR